MEVQLAIARNHRPMSKEAVAKMALEITLERNPKATEREVEFTETMISMEDALLCAGVPRGPLTPELAKLSDEVMKKHWAPYRAKWGIKPQSDEQGQADSQAQ